MIVNIDVASRVLNRILLKYLSVSRGSLIARMAFTNEGELFKYLKDTCRNTICIALIHAGNVNGEIYVTQENIVASYLEVGGEQLNGVNALNKLKELNNGYVEVYSFNPQVISYIHKHIDTLIKEVRSEAKTSGKIMTSMNTILRLIDIPCYIDELEFMNGEEMIYVDAACNDEDLTLYIILILLRLLDLYSISPSVINYSVRLKTLEQGIIKEKIVKKYLEIPDDTTRMIYLELPMILASVGSHLLNIEIKRQRGKIILNIEATPPIFTMEPDELASRIYNALSRYISKLEVNVEYTVKTPVGPVKTRGKAP
ncbi:hypothetical protein [Desulfurococcus amylolyticus]|uniref:hypothetical protein n=1 Tax=Desulfurococcus amylolyticus TaxID=94694 RepID=UPI0023F36A41|nr:hypothetical protein [Desulfurococcus amylolyticus]